MNGEPVTVTHHPLCLDRVLSQRLGPPGVLQSPWVGARGGHTAGPWRVKGGFKCTAVPGPCVWAPLFSGDYGCHLGHTVNLYVARDKVEQKVYSFQSVTGRHKEECSRGNREASNVGSGELGGDGKQTKVLRAGGWEWGFGKMCWDKGCSGVAEISLPLELTQGAEVKLRLGKLGKKREKWNGTLWGLDLSMWLCHTARHVPHSPRLEHPDRSQCGLACKELWVVGKNGDGHARPERTSQDPRGIKEKASVVLLVGLLIFHFFQLLGIWSHLPLGGTSLYMALLLPFSLGVLCLYLSAGWFKAAPTPCPPIRAADQPASPPDSSAQLQPLCPRGHKLTVPIFLRAPVHWCEVGQVTHASGWGPQLSSLTQNSLLETSILFLASLSSFIVWRWVGGWG